MVASCAVLAFPQQNPSGVDFHLVAYLVLAVGNALKQSGEEAKSFLFAKMKEVLPNYSLPDFVEILDQLPVNDHGKPMS